MKIVCLGVGSGKPNIEANHAAFLVRTEKKSVLLDCGEGVAKQLLKHNVDVDEIDDVFISHFHPDHAIGFFMLIQMFYLGKRKKSLRVFIPEKVQSFKEMLSFFYIFPDRLSFIIEWREMQKTEIVSPIQNDHLSGYGNIISKKGYENEMKAFSFYLKQGKKTVLYSSDLSSLRCLNKIPKVNVAILDGLHPIASEIIAWAEKSAEKVYLNHGLSMTLEKMLQRNKNKNITFTKEGEIIEI